MATEEQGPVIDLRAVSAMALDDIELARAPRRMLIFVFSGDFTDVTTLDERGFGLLLDFDAATRTVRSHYIRQQTSMNPREQPGSVRDMVTDPKSGLYVPKSMLQQGPEVTRLELGEIDVIRLDEGFTIIDGVKYARYLEELMQRPPGNDGYT